MLRLPLPLFLLPLLAGAQAPPKALLWKIDGPGLERPSYVVGTIHSRDARAFRQVPQLLRIMQGQDVLAGELDLTAVGTGLQLSAGDLMMPPDTQLADLYTKRQLKRVENAVQGPLGPMAKMAGRMKPFFLMGVLSELAMNADSAMVLDQYLQVKAREMGKETMGVETVGEQMAAVRGIPLRQQADMLYDMVRKDLNRKELDKMVRTYADQDLEALGRLAEKADLGEPFGSHLLTGRNAVMAARMDSLMRGGRTFLFALGALHLPMDGGVLALLRGRGYTVTPVAADRPGAVEVPTGP